MDIKIVDFNPKVKDDKELIEILNKIIKHIVKLIIFSG